MRDLKQQVVTSRALIEFNLNGAASQSKNGELVG